MRSSNPRTTGLRFLVVPVLASGLVLAACSGDDDTATPATTGVPATEAASSGQTSTTAETGGAAAAEFNDVDVEFAQGMIPHHEQAIEMAEIAQDPARQASPEVIDLAARIEAAQDPEIATLTGWLTAWGQPVEMDTSDGHDMSSMTGMMTAEDMDALATMTDADFGEAWLTMMIEHHQGAIEMANEEQSDGMNTDAKALAGQIVAAQQAEVDEMTALLDS